MKHRKIGVLLLAILLISGSVFAGGGNRNGTAGATQLLIPVGARGIAMSGATLTNAEGIDAMFWNPANLARSSNSVEAVFSHMDHIADIGVAYGAVAAKVGTLGTVALSIKSLDIGDIPTTTVTKPDGTGAFYTPSFVTLGLTYSTALSDRIAVGLTLNYISEEIDQVSTSGVAFNIGISYMNLANIDGFSFAIVIKNLGPQLKYNGAGLNVTADVPSFNRPNQYYRIDAASFELPSTLEIGLGYQYDINEYNKLQFSGSFENANFFEDEYRFGAEYAYNDMVFLRGGYSYMPQLDENARIYGLTAGFGVKYNMGGVDLKIDYAYREVEYFDASHMFSVGVGL